jgi:uncharacterized protein YwqG
MKPEHGVWYGIAFDTVLFGGMFLFFWAKDRVGRRNRRPAHRVEVGRAARLLARVRRLVAPTWLLIPAKEPGFSKLGGDPELPLGTKWPPGDRESRLFLGQIDLGAFRPHGGPDWLPDTGRFYVFYDPERHGCADVVSVYYCTEPAGPPVPRPPSRRSAFLERKVAFMAFRSAPSPEWLDVDCGELGVDIEALDTQVAAFADAPPDDELQHRIGGYPNEIQDECMPLSCELLARDHSRAASAHEVTPAARRASKEWRLLLQIDSDPALEMNFGDGGRLYVFIRERHARAADFSKTVTLWQTY